MRSPRPHPGPGRADRNAETAILQSYFRDVAQHGPISRDEEARLARSAREGDEPARLRLVEANLRFAIEYARRYQNRGLALPDLIQEANVGLTQASHRFDPEQGVRFISYAVWWIRQAILAAICDHGRTVRVPAHQRDRIRKVVSARDRLRSQLQRAPTVHEIGLAETLPPREVSLCLGLALDEASLDQPAAGTTESPPPRLGRRSSGPAPEAVSLVLSDGSDDLRLLLQSLERLERQSEREGRILRLYFGLDGREHTLEEIGALLGITRERVRQLRNRALGTLRDLMQGAAVA